MSFYVTPARRLCLVRAWSYLALVVGLVGLSFTFDMDETGRVFFYVIVGFFLISSLFNFHKARRTPPDETVTSNPDLAPVPDQIRYYRRMLIVSLIAFPGLAMWTLHQLNLLQSGTQETVEVWAPVSFIYDHFGYWAGVLLLPVIGIACCAVFLGKLRKLASVSQE